MNKIYTLSYPPSINHYYAVVNGRKILSAKGREYKEIAYYEIKKQKPFNFLNEDVKLKISVFPPDKRKRDLDNILKPVFDAFVCAKVINDDSQIKKLEVQFISVVKSGKLEVIIDYFCDSQL